MATKFKYFTQGMSVEIYIEVRNDGLVPSLATTAEAAISRAIRTTEAVPPAPAYVFIGRVNVPAIAPGATQRIYLTRLTLPTPSWDYDLIALVLVDPPSFGHPGGINAEPIEWDNTLAHTCHWFGENPQPSRFQVCN